jgi:hypothetical protein
MKIGRQLVLLGVMSLVVVCLPGIALGEDAAAPAQPAPAPTQPAPAVAQPAPAPAQPAAAPENPNGPMGGFTLTPKIGYVYLGGQGAHDITNSANVSVPGTSFNAMQIQLGLKFGGRGGATELGPFYMLMKPDEAGSEYAHALGLDFGYLYSWYIPAGGTAFYPGVGFDWKIGWVFASHVDYGLVSVVRIPMSCTWYPSKTTPIGVMLEVGLGFQTNVFIDKDFAGTGHLGAAINYGFYADVMAGVRFF